jgi:hypothetical protein
LRFFRAHAQLALCLTRTKADRKVAAECVHLLILAESEFAPDKNTAAFVHEMPRGTMANVDGDENYVRVQVLTNTGALDRDKQLALVAQLLIIA